MTSDWYQGEPLYSAEELISRFSVSVNDRRCGRCGEFSLVAIRYENPLVTLLLCRRCDTKPVL